MNNNKGYRGTIIEVSLNNTRHCQLVHRLNHENPEELARSLCKEVLRLHQKEMDRVKDTYPDQTFVDIMDNGLKRMRHFVLTDMHKSSYDYDEILKSMEGLFVKWNEYEHEHEYVLSIIPL